MDVASRAEHRVHRDGQRVDPLVDTDLAEEENDHGVAWQAEQVSRGCPGSDPDPRQSLQASVRS